MESIVINNRYYYSYENIIAKYPDFRNKYKCGSRFIEKYNLNSNHFVYAKKISNRLVISNTSGRKSDLLFIRKKYFDVLFEDIISRFDSIEDVPPEIYFDEDDAYGEIFSNITIVCKVNDYYFKADDVANYFDVDCKMDKKSTYTYDEDYVYFYEYDDDNYRHKTTYLTYTGILRVLFASHKKTTDKFISWASQTLFVSQMGTPDQKNILAANLLGVSANVVKEVFNKSSHSIPCVYLFSIGQVKSLRKKLKLDDDFDDNDYVYKWGMSIDLERRTKEHQKTFSVFKNSTLELVLFSFIDTQYISEAETSIKNFFEGMDMVIPHDKFSELAVIPKNKMKNVKNQYKLISQSYLGHVKNLITEIENLKKDHKMEIMEYKHKIEISEQRNESLMKDLEIAHLKSKLVKR